mgnify:CR=1 FL=1
MILLAADDEPEVPATVIPVPDIKFSAYVLVPVPAIWVPFTWIALQVLELLSLAQYTVVPLDFNTWPLEPGPKVVPPLDVGIFKTSNFTVPAEKSLIPSPETKFFAVNYPVRIALPVSQPIFNISCQPSAAVNVLVDWKAK